MSNSKEVVESSVKADAEKLAVAVAGIYNEIGHQVAELYQEPEWRDGYLAFYGEMNDRDGDDSKSEVSKVIESAGARVRWLRPLGEGEQYSFLVYTHSLDQLSKIGG